MASSAATDGFAGLTGAGGRAGLLRSGRTPAVLALHGFGGTPREVELVTEVARELGLASSAPRLPGHGTNAADLAQSRWTDWYDAARAALEEVTTQDQPALVVGLSLGAVLAVHLTALAPRRVAGLGLLANALWLYPTTELVLRAADRLGVPNLWAPKLGPDLRDTQARHDHPTYRFQPLRPAIDVMRSGQRARELIRRVRVPTFLAHGAHDRVCPPRNLQRAAARLPTGEVETLLLPQSRHVITRDLDRDQLRRALREFFARFARA